MKYGIKWRFWNKIEVWSRRVYYYASARCNKIGDNLVKAKDWPIVGSDSNIANTDGVYIKWKLNTTGELSKNK